MSKPDRIALTSLELEAAREWLADCEWADMEPEDFAALSDQRVRCAVSMFYDGGLRAFILDGGKRQQVTQAEWDAKHADFKLTASQSQDGVPYIMGCDARGTYLAPAIIISGR